MKLDRKVQLDLLEEMGHRDQQGPLVSQDLKGCLVNQGHLVMMVKLDLGVTPAFVVHLVSPVLLENRDDLDQQEQEDQPASQAHQAMQDNLASLAYRDSRVRQGQWVCQGLQGPQDPKENGALLDNLGPQVLQVKMEPQVHREMMVYQENEEARDQLEFQVPWVLQDLREREEVQDSQAPRERLVQEAP